jgi:LytR cell envelope-related transcriptional attenuator
MRGGSEAGAGGADVEERGADAESSGSEPEPHESGDAGPGVEPTEPNAAVVESDDEDPATHPPDDPDPDPDPDDPDHVEDAAPESPQVNGAEEPEDLAEPAAATAMDVDTPTSAPAPRFVPPPYDPTDVPPAEPDNADPEPEPIVQPPAVRPPVPQQYATGGVPIVEIEGGWEAVRRRRRRQTLTFLAGLVGVLVLGFLAWLTYAGVVPWPFGGSVTVAQNVCTHSKPLPPKKIIVRVFNGSARDGLAGQVAGQLKGLGFAVKTTGNDPLEAKIKTAVEIRHGDNGDVAAATMSAYVVGKAKDVQDDRQDTSIDLVLGPSFIRLHSKSELKKSLAAVTSTLPMTCPVGATPPPTATPTASGTPKARVTPRPTPKR